MHHTNLQAEGERAMNDLPWKQKQTVNFGATLVRIGEDRTVHLVAYAEDLREGPNTPEARTLRYIEGRKTLWSAETTICGLAAPWNFDVFAMENGRPLRKRDCSACINQMQGAYENMPGEVKALAGWGTVVDGVWSGPPFYSEKAKRAR